MLKNNFGAAMDGLVSGKSEAGIQNIKLNNKQLTSL